MWDDQKYSIQSVFKGNFSVSIQVGSNNGASWWLSAIYGPAKRKNRPMFWEELEKLKSFCLPTWILGGDFNVIRWKEETSTKNPASISMRRFNTFINNCNLIDPPPPSPMRSSPGQTSEHRPLFPDWTDFFFLPNGKTLSQAILQKL